MKTNRQSVLFAACLLVVLPSPGALGQEGQNVGLAVGQIVGLLDGTPEELATCEGEGEKLDIIMVSPEGTMVGALGFKEPFELTREFVPLDKPITALAPKCGSLKEEIKSFVVAFDNNPRELIKEDGLWQIRSAFTGLPDYFTQLPRVASGDLNGDGLDDVEYAAFDHPGPNSIELYRRTLDNLNWQHDGTLTDSANPFFHRREFDFALNSDWKAFAYTKLSTGIPTVDISPTEGAGATTRISLGSPSPTPPAGIVSQMRMITDGRFFYVVWQGSDNLIRAAIIDPQTAATLRFQLTLYSVAHGIMGLNLVAANRGLVAMWLDRQAFTPRVAFVTPGGTVLQGAGGRLDGLSALVTVYFHMIRQTFAGTRLEGLMFLSGNSLHVAPFTVSIPQSRRRAVRRQ